MVIPKKILAPIDFSTHSHEAFDAAVDIAGRYEAEIVLVHVVPMLPSLPSFKTAFHEGEYEKELHVEAERRLDAMVQELKARGIQARSVVGTANDIAMEILRTAEHEQTDLIVISTHGMGGWRQLAFGSVAEKVVRLASCAVLVIRPSTVGQSTAESHKEHSFRAAD